MDETQAQPLGKTVRSPRQIVVAWLVRVLIVTLVVTVWIWWQGGPDWLWTALAIYAAGSLILSFLLNHLLARQVDKIHDMIKEDDEEERDTPQE